MKKALPAGIAVLLMLLAVASCDQPLMGETDPEVVAAQYAQPGGEDGGSEPPPETPPGTPPETPPPGTPAPPAAPGDPAAPGETSGQHFFFLPPLAPAPAYTGTFAADVEPVVRILNEDTAATIVEFSMDGHGSEAVRQETSEELGDYFIVNFHVRRYDIPAETLLLIQVLVDDRVVGELPATVIQNGADKHKVIMDERVPIVMKRTVPVKFRIEEELFVPMGVIDVWPTNPQSVPELLEVPDYDDFTAVAAGIYHAIGLRADGSLVSWGRDTDGQISATPEGDGFVAVDAGLLYSMALHEDGTIYSWGGGLAASPGNEPGGEGFKAVGAGVAFAFAVTDDGTIVGWSLDTLLLDSIPAGTDFVSVRSGDQDHAIAIREDGSVEVFGTSTSGPVGVEIPAGQFVTVDIASAHAAGIRTDGSTVSWGGAVAAANNLIVDLSDGPYVDVAAGYRLGIAVRADGSLVTYGTSSNVGAFPTEPNGFFAAEVTAGSSGASANWAYTIRTVSD